jgi:hypothetical protein
MRILPLHEFSAEKRQKFPCVTPGHFGLTIWRAFIFPPFRVTFSSLGNARQKAESRQDDVGI